MRMTPAEQVQALPGPELGRCCARRVLGWDAAEPALAGFDPAGNLAQAMVLVEAMTGVDFVLHRYAGCAATPPFWMAWFGNGSQATAETAAAAVCRAALLYVLEKGRPGARFPRRRRGP
jgi:hypothetical protein